MERAVRAPDGRNIEVHEEGDPAGLPVIVHHGTPMSGLAYEPHAVLACEQGIRLVGYDRPGYAGSTRRRGRLVADCVDDVHAIADALEIDRFATWGISGGGPHALACATLSDDRLVAAASLGGVAPWDAVGLDWLAGMGEDNELEFAKTLEGEAALRPFLEELGKAMLGAGEGAAAELVLRLETLLGPADRALLTTGFGEYFLACERHGLASGVDGWVDDDLAFVDRWGFEPAAARVPVLLVHGEEDRFVPVSHGQWLARNIPGVEAWIDPADGHLTLLENRMREVNEWLLAHA
jgi:pimeloyl-ACP methyl ester carboxylesterase